MQKGKKNMQFHNIPNDVIVEILLRLPAKSLLRFRWACKYWFDLISKDTSFTKMHLLLQQHSTAINPCSVLISNIKSGGGCITISYKFFQCYLNYYADISSHEAVMTPHPLDLPSPSDSHCEILGSCNGLILMLIRQDESRNLCIWNPCTKECRELPLPLWPLRLYRMYFNYGFSYDSTTDDYIVIRQAYGEHDDYISSDVQVFTLGTNLWRRIGSRPYFKCTEDKLALPVPEMVCVNGVLYWMDSLDGEMVCVNGVLYWMDSLDGDGNGDINCFNIGMEKFQQMLKIPKVIDKIDCAKLQVFQGSLCVVLDIVIEQSYHVEMWVMKDYDESLWTKLFTFRNLNNYPSYAKPLRYTNSGEILMVKNEKELVLYDPRINEDKILFSVCEEPSHFIEEVYVDSLVSLNSGNEGNEHEQEEDDI